MMRFLEDCLQVEAVSHAHLVYGFESRRASTLGGLSYVYSNERVENLKYGNSTAPI
jgi:hypothetical protein